MEDFFKSLILSKTVKPVHTVEIFFNTSFNANLKIIFADDTVVFHKISGAFRLFLIIMQFVNIEKCYIPKEMCTSIPLHYYDIFGFIKEDTGKFSKTDHEMLIYFL